MWIDLESSACVWGYESPASVPSWIKANRPHMCSIDTKLTYQMWNVLWYRPAWLSHVVPQAEQSWYYPNIISFYHQSNKQSVFDCKHRLPPVNQSQPLPGLTWSHDQKLRDFTPSCLKLWTPQSSAVYSSKRPNVYIKASIHTSTGPLVPVPCRLLAWSVCHWCY